MRNRSPFTFSLSDARHLPVTGSLHPLRAESARWLSAGNAVTVMTAGLLIAAFALLQSDVPLGVKPPVKIVDVTIVDYAAPLRPVARNYTPADVQPPDGVFEPVDKVVEPANDVDAQFGGGPVGDFSGEPNPDGDLFEGLPAPPPPPAPVYEAFDELPVCLSIQPPDYPALARQAGIDGMVLVQVLVGRDGKVRDARVLEGPDVLHAAALASVRTAVFKPALQGTRPVEVWVVIPVVFELQRGR